RRGPAPRGGPRRTRTLGTRPPVREDRPDDRLTEGISDMDGELERIAAFRTELRRFLSRTAVATAEAGLTPERYDLLLMIKAAADSGQPSTVTQLCDSLQLRQTAVSELVKRAEEA